jgi:hypothetical protein
MKGELGIIQKDEGNGLMVSAFQSREIGFGLELTSAQLQVINDFFHLKRPQYTEVESAKNLNKTSM